MSYRITVRRGPKVERERARLARRGDRGRRALRPRHAPRARRVEASAAATRRSDLVAVRIELKGPGGRGRRRRARRRRRDRLDAAGCSARSSTGESPTRRCGALTALSVEPVAAQPRRVLAPARRARREQPPEARRVVHHLEVADLVLDDVVEDLRRREQQPPVERHRARGRARRPARALRRGSSGRCSASRRARTPRPAAARSRRFAWRRYQRSSAGARVARRDQQRVAAAMHARRGPARGTSRSVSPRYGHGARRAADLERDPRHRPAAPLDPRRRARRTASAAWRSGERRGQHDLDCRRCRRR